MIGIIRLKKSQNVNGSKNKSLTVTCIPAISHALGASLPA